MFGTSYSTYVRQLDYFQALIIVVLPLNITPYEWLQKKNSTTPPEHMHIEEIGKPKTRHA